MTEIAEGRHGSHAGRGGAARRAAHSRLLRATEIDTRLLGMVGALAADLDRLPDLSADLTGEGVFLTPRNLWNLLVQTSSIAVMAPAWCSIIVMRHIDLSVGSIARASIGVIIGVTQVYCPAALCSASIIRRSGSSA